MAWRQKVGGGIMAMVGFLLSPLSWWNDLFINVPIALVFAWGISLFYKPAFEPALIVGYWLTNVAGFILMHKGARRMLAGEPKPYSRPDLLRDVGISLLYTGLLVLLIELKVLKPASSFFVGN